MPLRSIDQATGLQPQPGERPSLAVAQLLQLRRQLPWLYALLIITAGSMTLTHLHRAPPILSVAIPSVLGMVALWRMVCWMMPLRPALMTEAGALRALRRVTVAGVVLACAFTFWAIALDGYNDNPHHGNIGIYAGITLLGCLFCLMHLPKAAGMVAMTVCIPYGVYALWTGHLSTMASAVNLALVAGVITRVLAEAHRSFNALIESRYELAAKHSETKRLSDENRQLAHTDVLTGLPNRRFYFSRLEELLTHRKGRCDCPFAVGVLDLDRFKPINDTFGHATGDRLLAAIGDRLQTHGSDRMLVARLGGDEFGIIYDGPRDEAEALVRAMCEDVQRTTRLDDIALRIGCSGGIAMFPEAGTSAHELFDRSDFALYHVKSRNRGSCAVFAAEHEAEVRSEQQIETALCAADLDRELDVHFQPIFDTREMHVRSVEALARWTSPMLGHVAASRLIATAERSGQMNKVTLALFRRALAAFIQIPAPISLNFNLSAQDIGSDATISAIIAMIRQSGLPFDRFVFEVTETSLVRDIDGARRVLGRLRGMGARIALDDFGTGYSSLGTLYELPLDILKVDRSFAMGMGSASGRKIVSAIRTLAQSLNLDCTIEGIETETQFMESALIGYREAQGYLLSRPMPIADLLYALPGWQKPSPAAADSKTAAGTKKCPPSEDGGPRVGMFAGGTSSAPEERSPALNRVTQ